MIPSYTLGGREGEKEEQMHRVITFCVQNGEQRRHI